METFVQDVKHSFRIFRKNPGFTLSAVAALALGIGANTAIFSVINAVLLSPVRYVDPDRVVMFMTTTPEGPVYQASDPKFNAWRQENSVFQDVSGYRYGIMNLTGGDYPEQIQFAQVTGDYFRLSGLPIARGRSFTSDEERPRSRGVAVLSDSLWKRRFSGDPQIVGKTISLGGAPCEVVGIVAAGVQTERDPPPDVWIPFPIDPASNDQKHYFTVAARLKPGVTVEQANSRLQLTAQEFRRKFPTALVMGPQAGFSVRVMRDVLVGEVRSSLMLLGGAVSFVLLIACANVANLLLVRAAARKGEIAIRAAIGAGRGRILRQLLTESAVLSLAGGGLGLALGMVGIHALLTLNPGNIPRIGDHGSAVTMDWRVVAFTVLVSLVSGVFFGLFPAIQSSRLNLSPSLKGGGGRSGAGFRQNKVRSLLVVSEIALALVLLVGAALLIRTFMALRTVDPGFDRHHVLTLRMSLTSPRFDKTSGVAELARNGVQRLTALPGVVAAGVAPYVPFEVGSTLPFIIAGRPLSGPFHGAGPWRSISPRFFEVFRIPLLRGRVFSEHDEGGTAGVVIINQAMARQYWPGGDPLRERIIIAKGVAPAFDEPPRQIVGIVGDVHDDGLDRNPRPTMYVPLAQVTDGFNAILARGRPIAWIVRTRGEPHALTSAIQDELRQASGGLPAASLRTMDQIVAQSTARSDFNTSLLTTFGCSALLLAAIGIYGLMAYSIQQRTREIGIRLALGAEAGHVRNTVVFQGMRLALAGIAIGLAAAFGLRRLLANFLFGIEAVDPVAFTIVPVLLGAVALLSIWIPARRVSRIDPVDALRCE